MLDADKCVRIGVVGYSAQKFDEKTASKYIAEFFDEVKDSTAFLSYDPIMVVVSGLTNLGIPALAYKEATKRGWKTVGIACSKAKDYECYPVDYTHIVGDNWGDESETFLKSIDILLKIGGGKQSSEEFKKAKEKGLDVEEYQLEAVK